MKKKLFILLSIVFLDCNAQELSFVSAYEKEIITQFNNDSLSFDFLDSLIAYDSISNFDKGNEIKNTLDTFIQDFKASKFFNKSKSKMLKALYSSVHDEFFTKYDGEAYFLDIFNKGYYNCATASALYCYVFDELKIPYSIKETPTHVFLIAYPDKENIYIETTVPGTDGFHEPSEKSVNESVDYLVKMKIYTKEEVDQKGKRETYNNFFYGDENITKAELVGVQYYNRAIFNLDDDNIKEAYEDVKKASVYFPSSKTKVLEQHLTRTLLLDENNKTNIVDLFISFANSFNQDTYDESFLEYVIYKLSKKVSGETLSRLGTDETLSLIKNTDIRDKTKYTLYKTLAKIYIDELDYNNALTYSKKSYEINTDDYDIQRIITYSSINKLSNSAFDEELLPILASYEENYPFLKSKVGFNSVKATLYGKLAYDNYIGQEIKTAEEYIKKLETLISQKPINLNKRLLSELYFEAGKHYYRHNLFEKAERYLLIAKDYTPNNTQINNHLNWIEEEK